ncbi:MAG: CpaD family pilus assembly protein [Magnetospirillum sp. WYHS-4]
MRTWILLATVPLALAACAEPNTGTDYQVSHPLVVRDETVRLTLKTPVSAEGMAIEDQLRLHRFVDHFRARGRGSIRVQALGGQGGYETGAWMDGARGLLLRAGLRGEEIALATEGTGDDGGSPVVVLSFTGSTVDVPNCGKVSLNISFNPNNLPMPDWGCSVQRNLGLMVENPRDLLQARPETSRDPARTVTTVNDYRAGSVTATSKSNEQQHGFIGSESTGRATPGGDTARSVTPSGSTATAAPAPTPAPAPSPAPMPAPSQ